MIVRVIKLRRMIWAGHIERVGRGGVYRGLVGRPKRKRSPGILRRRLEDNIKRFFKKCDGDMDWTELA